MESANVSVPEDAIRNGFVNQPVGTHGSRTIMLSEMSLLMAAAPLDASYSHYRALVIDDNIVQKGTVSGRKEVFRRLAELYSFRLSLPVFSAFRLLWRVSESEDRLLALLLACARDPLLRVTASVVLGAVEGQQVTPAALAEAVDTAYPGRYNPGSRASIGRHTISSWAQSGHLQGRNKKVRTRVNAGPVATAYAMFLGHLCGVRGLSVFDTFWTSLLDSTPAVLDQMAFAASQRGLIDYRRIGDVAEFGFTYLSSSVGRSA